MRTESDNTHQHQAVIELLPWYANASLGIHETRQVERHVGECEGCRNELADLQILGQALGAERLSVLPPAPDPGAFLEEIRGEPRKISKRLTAPDIAAIAAVLALIAVGVSLIVVNLRNDSAVAPGGFQTVTSPARVTNFEYVLRLQFEDQVDAMQRSKIIALIGATVIAGPDADNAYRVQLTRPAQTLAELEDFSAGLESLPDVRRVQALALQFPETVQ